MVKDLIETTLDNEALIPAQRHNMIVQHLALQKIASNSALAKKLGVSESTIRRDLEWLEEQGVLERTRGGAVLGQRIRSEAEYIQRAQRNIDQKKRIGSHAAGLIEEGDVVFINSGTTTAEVFRHIQGVHNVTVITNNTAALTNTPEVDFELIMLGGSFLPRSNAVVGMFATDNLRQIYATKTIIGVDGFSIKYGCTVPTPLEAEVVRLMIENTQGPVIIVTDHSKWGAVSNHLVARIDQVHTLVTDDMFDHNARIELAGRNINLVIANN